MWSFGWITSYKYFWDLLRVNDKRAKNDLANQPYMDFLQDFWSSRPPKATKETKLSLNKRKGLFMNMLVKKKEKKINSFQNRTAA